MRSSQYLFLAAALALVAGATGCKKSAPPRHSYDPVAGELYVAIGEICELGEEGSEEDEPQSRIAMAGFAKHAVALADRLSLPPDFQTRLRTLSQRIPTAEMYWIDDEAAAIRAELLKSFRLPTPPAKADAIEGAHLYASACAPCHGSNGEPLPEVSARMNPPPVNLRMLARAGADFDASWVFLVIGHGVPTTAMPPFHHAFSEQDRWNITTFIQSMK